MAFRDVPTTKRRCTARVRHGERAGERCRRAPVPGVNVCFKHGGNASQARQAGIERMLMLVEPGMYLLRQIIMDEDASYSDRMKALQIALDRCGLHAGVRLEATFAAEMPGWQAVLADLFDSRERLAIEGEVIEPDSDLADLTRAYERAGMRDPSERREFAERTLGGDVETAHDLSTIEIQRIIDALERRVIDVEVVEEEPDPRRYEQPDPSGAYRPHYREPGARIHRARFR